MSKPATETLSVVVEREVPFPPEKVWRALTQPELIEKWLMKNDFKPVVDHAFTLRADWGAVDCKAVPERRSLIRDRNRSKRLSFLRSRLALRLAGMTMCAGPTVGIRRRQRQTLA